MAKSTTVLHRCQIAPSTEVAALELLLPLVHFDIVFMFFHPIQRLLFFELPCSKSQFLDSIVPNLKNTLALSLAHFLPFAGKIVSPLDDARRPVARFVEGDAVTLTVAESGEDFDILTGNHSRLADDFYGCVPELPPAKKLENEIVFPALALQITLFPGRGLSLGFTTDHGIADASSIVRFIKFWASVNKSGGDAKTIGDESLPSFDRSTVEDPEGLDSIYWNVIKNSRPMESPAMSFPLNKFRSTFVLSSDDVSRLKRFVLKHQPSTHVTTFTVTCALVWVCLAKADATLAAVGADEPEYFAFAADGRSRLNPPLPAAYFGNCLTFVKAESTHGALTADGGIAAAAECLGEAIKKGVYNERGILDGAETWPGEFGKLAGKRVFGVAGSPRFDLYDVDYGWGRAKKFESPSIDADSSMSLCKSRDLEGGLEIGLSRGRDVLEAFAEVFAETVEKL